jgi:hypothetical protein
MAVVVPGGSPNSALYQQIVTLQGLITSKKGTPHAVSYAAQLPELYKQLVNGLLNSGELTAASILSNMTYKQAETGTLY